MIDNALNSSFQIRFIFPQQLLYRHKPYQTIHFDACHVVTKIIGSHCQHGVINETVQSYYGM